MVLRRANTGLGVLPILKPCDTVKIAQTRGELNRRPRNLARAVDTPRALLRIGGGGSPDVGEAGIEHPFEDRAGLAGLDVQDHLRKAAAQGEGSKKH